MTQELGDEKKNNNNIQPHGLTADGSQTMRSAKTERENAEAKIQEKIASR